MVTQKERMCTARAGWVATLVVGLYKIAIGGMTIYSEGAVWVKVETFDYSGFALVLAAVGAAYWGRQDSKRKERCNNA